MVEAEEQGCESDEAGCMPCQGLRDGCIISPYVSYRGELSRVALHLGTHMGEIQNGLVVVVVVVGWDL